MVKHILFIRKVSIDVNPNECAAAGTYRYMWGGVRSKKGGVCYKKGGVCNITGGVRNNAQLNGLGTYTVLRKLNIELELSCRPDYTSSYTCKTPVMLS
jgi:hypothetical protein